MKIRYTLVLLALIGITSAFAQDTNCPICPPGDGGGDPGTNVYTPSTNAPQEFPLNALLERMASISTGGIQIYTNYGWMVDTNTGLLVGAGASPFDNSLSGDFTYYDVYIAVTNALTNLAYTVQYTTNLGAGPWNDVSAPFTGNSDGSEVVKDIQFSSLSGNGFFRVKQQPGFVVWTKAGPNGSQSGPSGGCPGTYVGYVVYVPDGNASTNANWGWAPDTNYSTAIMTDLSSHTDVRVEYGGAYGDEGCGSSNVSFPIPGAFSPYYRFSTVFKTTYPTNQWWPLWLQGFVVNTNNP